MQPGAGATGEDDAAHGHHPRHNRLGSARMQRLLVTGGAGFIGSNFVHHVVDTLTRASPCSTS